MSFEKQKNLSVVETGEKMFVNIIRGAGIAFCFLFLFSALVAALCRMAYASNFAVFVCGFFVVGISAFLAGFFASRGVFRSGIFHGALSGILFFVILAAVSFAFKKSGAISVDLLVKFALSLCLGALGGIFGINSKKSRVSRRK